MVWYGREKKKKRMNDVEERREREVNDMMCDVLATSQPQGFAETWASVQWIHRQIDV